MMKLEEFTVKALAVPFEAKGRSMQGWDCWGLIVEAYKHVLGIEIPSYLEGYVETDVYGTDALATLIQHHMPKWGLVDDREAMDVALFRCRGRLVHTGLLIDSRMVLHTEMDSRGGGRTFVERIDSIMWARRLGGVYRLAR